MQVTVDDEDYNTVSLYTWRLQETRSGNVYACSDVPSQGRRIFMHTLIMGTKGVDHIDGNGLNNVRSNLRPATASQNAANRKAQGGSSRYKGVSWHKRSCKWQAQIKRTNLGYFDDEKEAARAYDDAAREDYGEFARLNFPEEGM